jgi:hypothetical protein
VWEQGWLKLLVKLTSRAGDIHSTWDISFTIFYPFHDARWFAALGTIRALGSVHNFFTISRFGDLSHDQFSPAKINAVARSGSGAEKAETLDAEMIVEPLRTFYNRLSFTRR